MLILIDPRNQVFIQLASKERYKDAELSGWDQVSLRKRLNAYYLILIKAKASFLDRLFQRYTKLFCFHSPGAMEDGALLSFGQSQTFVSKGFPQLL